MLEVGELAVGDVLDNVLKVGTLDFEDVPEEAVDAEGALCEEVALDSALEVAALEVDPIEVEGALDDVLEVCPLVVDVLEEPVDGVVVLDGMLVVGTLEIEDVLDDIVEADAEVGAVVTPDDT